MKTGAYSLPVAIRHLVDVDHHGKSFLLQATFVDKDVLSYRANEPRQLIYIYAFNTAKISEENRVRRT